jgi:SAM-dependent methyltransferase
MPGRIGRVEDDPAPAWAVAHYREGTEESRLLAGPGLLEQERTRELLQRYLPRPPARVADIGAGPGAYSLWLAELGYGVVARDLVPLHVDQLRASAQQCRLPIQAAIADARRLDLPDASFDAVLSSVRSTTCRNARVGCRPCGRRLGS